MKPGSSVASPRSITLAFAGAAAADRHDLVAFDDDAFRLA